MTSGSTLRVNLAMMVSYDVLRDNICSIRNKAHLVKPGRQAGQLSRKRWLTLLGYIVFSRVISRGALENIPEKASKQESRITCGRMSGLDHDLGHIWPRSRTPDVRMLLASGAEGIVPLAEAAGMADTLSMAYRRAVCSHTDDAVGYIIPGCVGFVPEGALLAPRVSSRGRGRPCRLPNAYGLLWSCSSCSGAQAPSLWTSQPCKRGRDILP